MTPKTSHTPPAPEPLLIDSAARDWLDSTEAKNLAYPETNDLAELDEVMMAAFRAGAEWQRKQDA